MSGQVVGGVAPVFAGLIVEARALATHTTVDDGGEFVEWFDPEEFLRILTAARGGVVVGDSVLLGGQLEVGR